jgi:hypothetical protein
MMKISSFIICMDKKMIPSKCTIWSLLSYLITQILTSYSVQLGREKGRKVAFKFCRRNG